MKNTRMIALLVCMLGSFAMSTSAQAARKWTYEGRSDDRLTRVVTFIITEKPNGYEVSGDIKLVGSGLDDVFCQIHGRYIREKGLVMADCGAGADYTLVTASKMPNADSFTVKLERNKRVTEFAAYRIANRSEKPDILGAWNSNTPAKYIYTIVPDGDGFAWYLSEIREQGKIIVKGDTLYASWTNQRTSGSATGRVTKFDANNRATRIEWSNGGIFTR